MGFNSAFKGLMILLRCISYIVS